MSLRPIYGFPTLLRLSLWSSLLIPMASALAEPGPTPAVEPWQELREQLRSTRNFRLGAPFNVHVLDDGARVLYQKAIPPSTAAAVYEFDRRTGKETKVLDAAMLSPGEGPVSAEEKALRERLRLLTGGISFYENDPQGAWILTPVKGKLFLYDRKTQKNREIGPGQGPAFGPKISPDAKQVAFVRASNLYVAPLSGGAAVALTKGGTEEKSFGVAEFIAQEELNRKDGFWWSPDSRTLLLQAVDQSHVERLSIADPFRPDAEPQRPYYPRPGKANAKFRFGFISAKGGAITWIDFGKEPFEYVGPVQWSKHGKPSFLLLNRLQNEARLVIADPKTGRTQTLLKETDAAWVDIDRSVPLWLPNKQGFIWSSERTGPKRLELHDESGRFLRMLSPENLHVRGVLGASADGQTVYYEAAADSVASQIYATRIQDGSTQPVLQQEGGSAAVTSRFHEQLFAARVTTLQGDDKTIVRTWTDDKEQVLPSAAAEPVMKTNATIVRIGPQEIRTIIIRPSNFDPKKKYPVLEHAYGGPGSLQVRASGRPYLEDQVLADALQTVVVRMDTRGTPDRGRDWEKAIFKKFGSLPVEEHAEALKLLCREYPELDANRIGVFGWSYGGYFAAYAVLARPDVYKAGVAGAPPVDWLDYDTAYTERYLGLPEKDKDAYASSSLLTLLQPERRSKTPRPLLVIHGTADDNVFFFNSMKLVDSLERAAWPYEFLPLMGQTHMISDAELDARRFERTLHFFRQHLQLTK
ncbi:S9 family peptidase [Oligoflexus tunisiensis]|uniref:S9 family peptidase n=1 Tax=Oligoflexus tunisiensis TaxID=708132 RepID=UPI000A50ADB7|nr:DPP IV N-terminal domain-containing protein [Oligoflexus tunisiensis]